MNFNSKSFFANLLPAIALVAVLVLGSTGFGQEAKDQAAPPQADQADQAEWPGKKTKFHGFDLFSFSHEDLNCKVVVPNEVAEGTPWVWRARFFGHQPQADIALLEQGFHVAFVDTAGLFGSPKAVAHWDTFYNYLTTEKGFSPKPALEGMSRGGLCVYNWAAANADKVACIYGDAPVCDIKSWPGGKGVGEGSDKNWPICLAAYGMTEAEALMYQKNPVDQLASLATAEVPLLHVVGEADTVVPVVENTNLIETRYKELGGSIEVIRKPGVGHHPHSLKDPTPIVDFILKHTAAQRSPIRIACVGDSITFGAKVEDRVTNCYPAQLGQLLGDGYVVRNFGVSGATMLKQGNKPYWRTHRFKPAHDFAPDIVIIKLGTNDSKPENWQHEEAFVADYVAMIESFRVLPSQPIVHICYPVPAYPGNFKITDKVIREDVMPKITAVAQQAEVEIIDLYAALSDRADLFPDRVHPNAAGARLMAETIGAFLRKGDEAEEAADGNR